MPPKNSSSSNSKDDDDGQPSRDPYDVLGVDPTTASDADIGRAYRRLALKLHPDKNVGSLSPGRAEALAREFHDVKEARAFLLEPDRAAARRRYDAKRASDRARKATDEIRDRAMSDRRRRMGEELREREASARRREQEKQQPPGGGGRQPRGRTKDGEDLDRLRRDGKRRREEQAERDLQREVERQAGQAREADTEVADAAAAALEDRQVRLKWDRKKMQPPGPSEGSLAASLSRRFGPVEAVEMLGRKGNQALVTFAGAASCRPCVDYYATSAEMRAKFVGRRRRDDDVDDGREADDAAPAPHRTRHEHAAESLEDRKRRQAAERERLLRTMEMEEGGGEAGGETEVPPPNAGRNLKGQQQRPIFKSLFPLPIPVSSKGGVTLSPLQALEEFEDSILGGLLVPEKLQSMKASTAKQ